MSDNEQNNRQMVRLKLRTIIKELRLIRSVTAETLFSYIPASHRKPLTNWTGSDCTKAKLVQGCFELTDVEYKRALEENEFCDTSSNT